jgi:hypothetical protein
LLLVSVCEALLFQVPNLTKSKTLAKFDYHKFNIDKLVLQDNLSHDKTRMVCIEA